MKRKKIVLIFLNIFIFTIWMCSILIPSERKNAEYVNIDISDYSGVSSVPLIGAITNNRCAQLEFNLYNEKIYGMSLFFYAKGECDEGELVCTLKYENQSIDQTRVPVKELFTLMSGSSVNAKELVFGSKPEKSGKYTLVLEGEGIDSETRISLYGNKNVQRHVNYVNADYQNYTGILYMIETLEEKHPYMWFASLLLSMSLLFSYMIYMDDEEKKREITECGKEK